MQQYFCNSIVAIMPFFPTAIKTYYKNIYFGINKVWTQNLVKIFQCFQHVSILCQYSQYHIDRNHNFKRKFLRFPITCNMFNPIRPGLFGGIKSWGREGGEDKKPHLWKPSSDCQNALKFDLSNIWDISFCLKLLWLTLCINMHNMSKY